MRLEALYLWHNAPLLLVTRNSQLATPKAEMKQLLKFYRYLLKWVKWENYLLLARTVQAAWLVRRTIKEDAVSPRFASALTAVDDLYLSPQPGWKISEPEKIARFAAFVVSIPVRWGKCVQQSLIVYRLLNGYGIPAKVCYGVSRNGTENDGHAWVIISDRPDRPFAEAADPRERFTTVFVSSKP